AASSASQIWRAIGHTSSSGSASHADRLARQAPLHEKIAGTKHCHAGLPARLRQGGQLDAASLNVHDMMAGVALGEYDVASSVLDDHLRHARRLKKGLRVESGRRLRDGTVRFSGFSSRFHIPNMTTRLGTCATREQSMARPGPSRQGSEE